ncbi:MAG: Ig-like domain-containing protein [Clostridia bacterium]|nr:Ig-like domain-containing protein [Clostridia bacterium]
MAVYYIPFSMDRNHNDDVTFRMKVEETPLIDKNKSRITTTIEYCNKGSTISNYEFDALIKVNGNVIEDRSINTNHRFALEGGGAWHTLKFMQETIDVSHTSNGGGTFSVYAEIEADKYALTLLIPLTKGSVSCSYSLTSIDQSTPTISDFSISANRYGLDAKVSFAASHQNYNLSSIKFTLRNLTYAQVGARVGKATEADESRREPYTDGTYGLILTKSANLSTSNSIFFDLDSVNETDYPLDSGSSYDYELTVTAENGKTATETGTLKVPQKVTGISCESQIELMPNQTAELNFQVIPQNSEEMGVDFTSTDPTVATVDGNGNITAEGDGVCQIIVTTRDGGFSASCAMSVLNTEVFPRLSEIRYLTVRDIAKLAFACNFLRDKLINLGINVPELTVVACEGRNHPVKEIRTVLETVETNCQTLKSASGGFPTSAMSETQSLKKYNSDYGWFTAVNEWIKFLNELNESIEKEA